jgi:hypothetical protein
MIKWIGEFLSGALLALSLVVLSITAIAIFISIFSFILYALAAIPALIIYVSYKLASTPDWPAIGYQTIWSGFVVLLLISSLVRSIFPYRKD